MEHANRPNILLLMADQFRWDCLGIAGHPDVKTPNLDSLAARGLRFSNAVSACPTCIPARAAALTGMSQEKNGRVGYQDGIPWHYAHTLPSEMTAAGYQTRCVGKMHVHPPRANMGYEEVELHDGYLHSLFVHKDWQGKGVASALLSETEIYAIRKLGATEITSEVSITARPFFEKQGYTAVKEQKAQANRLKLTNYVMTKAL